MAYANRRVFIGTTGEKPATGLTDELYYDRTLGRLYVGTGAGWTELTCPAAGTSLVCSGTLQGAHLISTSEDDNESEINWNYAQLRLVRNASNATTTKLMSFLLDSDDWSNTTLTALWNLVLITAANPTTGSTSASTTNLAFYGPGQFQVVGDYSGYKMQIFNDGNATDRAGLLIQAGKDTPSSSGDCVWIRFNDGNGTGVGWLAYNSATTPNVSIQSISDRKLKKHIRDTKVNGLDVITKIRLREFEWRRRGRGKQAIGYVAQEVEQVYPPMVGEIEGQKTVGDACLVPVLVKAVQELTAEVRALQARVVALEEVT